MSSHEHQCNGLWIVTYHKLSELLWTFINMIWLFGNLCSQAFNHFIQFDNGHFKKSRSKKYYICVQTSGSGWCFSYHFGYGDFYSPFRVDISNFGGYRGDRRLSLLWIDFPPFMPPFLSHHSVDIPVLFRREKNYFSLSNMGKT